MPNVKKIQYCHREWDDPPDPTPDGETKKVGYWVVCHRCKAMWSVDRKGFRPSNCIERKTAEMALYTRGYK